MTPRLRRRYREKPQGMTSSRASTVGMNAKDRIGARASLLGVQYGNMGVFDTPERQRNMERIIRAARNDRARLEARQRWQRDENRRIREAANETRIRNGLSPLSLSNG